MTGEDPTALPERPRDPERARTRAERARKAERVRVATEGAPVENEARREPDSPLRIVRGAGRWIRGAFVANYPIKAVALILALAVFVLVQSDEDVEISVYVNLHYAEPEDRVLVSDPVEQVRLTVSGSSRRIQRFDERAIERVPIDLSDRQSGEFYFNSDMFDVPEGLRVLAITPPSTALHFEPRDRKSVPVKVTTVGEVVEGFVVDRMRVTPERVLVTGAKSMVAGVESVTTRQIALDGRSVSFEDTVPLVMPRPQLELVGERFVRVEVTIEERIEDLEAGRRAITLEAPEDVEIEAIEGFLVEPASVALSLRGAARLLQQIDPDDISVIVKLSGDDLDGGGPRAAPVEIRGIPDEIEVTLEPREVTIHPPT